MQSFGFRMFLKMAFTLVAVFVTVVWLAPTATKPTAAQSQDEMSAADAPAGTIWVDSLDLSKVIQDYRTAKAGRSVDNRPLTMKGTVYAHGIGTHAFSDMLIDLKGAASRFAAMVGVDQESLVGGSVEFEIWVDGKKVADSGVMRGAAAPKLLVADLRGAKRLELIVNDAGDGTDLDHADWAGAMIALVPGATAMPVSLLRPVEPAPPIKSTVAAKPAIHGPTVIGASPGKPFLFLIPATGKTPLRFSGTGLPAGVALDASAGIISGVISEPGVSLAKLSVRGPAGRASRNLKIVCQEHSLALTPPMGWNSWNVWAGSIDDRKVRDAADWIVKSGLAAHGFEYINIDDTWEGARDQAGELQTNKKFPDMKALAEYVHSKGLKLGIYSSPGPKTCAGFEGSQGHEEQDAKTYADWGIDYLKYDWCSYRGKDLKVPYQVMRTALDKSNRDIVYSLCQYGMGNVWEWGQSVGGNLWRTTGDIVDTWSSMSNIGFKQNGHESYAGPGHWNDPDMLVVGRLGWGPQIHPTRLAPNEQMTHITLWSLLSAPLLIGCDMADLDSFTLALLTNDEVLAIDQDPLGKPASRKSTLGSSEVWARPLDDGSLAVGLFNRDRGSTRITVKWADLGITGQQRVRDLWLHKDLGIFDRSFTALVRAHGVMLAKISARR
jgi:alpha-galactosidase